MDYNGWEVIGFYIYNYRSTEPHSIVNIRVDVDKNLEKDFNLFYF